MQLMILLLPLSHVVITIKLAISAAPERLRLRLGILGSDIAEKPISHNFVSSSANWDNLEAALPRYDSYEPSRGIS